MSLKGYDANISAVVSQRRENFPGSRILRAICISRLRIEIGKAMRILSDPDPPYC
jgi:hypothetical protein